MKFSLAAVTLAAIGVSAAKFSVTPISQLMQGGASLNGLTKRDTSPELLYPAHTFDVAVDHFHNESKYAPHTSELYPMRYWFDATFYKAGGPVIVLCSGEDSGEDRLIYLQKGIVYELAKATGGIGVILEHRYYGGSWPTSNLTTESLRFLTTEQALADTAAFAQNVVFPGMEDLNLTSSATPWIAYGGSYAGAFVAFLRKLYPDVFWGAISSSGVTEAIYDYWQYYEPIKTFGPAKCINNLQLLTHAMDNILMESENKYLIPQLKQLFGLGAVIHAQDFMNTIAGFGIGQWQGLNWDPALDDTLVYTFCDAIANNTLMYTTTKKKTQVAQDILTVGGYGDRLDTLTNPLLNWVGYIMEIVSESCGSDVNACLTTFNATYYAQDDITQEWRSWPYQYCTQWGYLQTGSGVPSTQLPLISRTIDLNYTSMICRDAFGIDTPSNTQAINKYGGFHITYPRLAIIGGQWDPWRPATPLSPTVKPWPTSTTDEPVILISKAVHHWDENGLFPNQTTASLPPAPIVAVHAQEQAFVEAWLEEASGVFPRA